MSSVNPEQELISHLARERDHSVALTLDRAEAEAGALLAEARARARARVREAVTEERRRAERELRGVTARAETRLRQRFHQAASELLQRTSPLLAEALEQRWQDPEARRRWLEDTLALARRRLPAGSWTLQHPPDLGESELRRALDGISAPEADLHITPQPAAQITAGVRVCCGGACLDASRDGLLADPQRIRALLLARLEAAGALPGREAED